MPTLSGVPRFFRRHSFAVQVVAVLAVMLPVWHYAARHPSRDQVLDHMAQVSFVGGGVPHLSEAEIRVMRGAEPLLPPGQQEVTEDTYRGTRHVTLPRPGALRAVASYADGFFTLSDQRHPGAEEAGVGEAQQRRSVAGGPPGQVSVLACCEGNDAPVTLVLRTTAPPRPPSPRPWAQVTDLDLDLPHGRLALSNEGVAGEIVDLPAGRYRMRVAGTGAAGDSAVRDERFRVELWPRRGDTPMDVVRPAYR